LAVFKDPFERGQRLIPDDVQVELSQDNHLP
jgi:hypothetical protein